MKKIFQSHWLISFIFLFALSCILYSCFQFIENQNKIEEFEKQQIAYCQSQLSQQEDIEYCQHYLSSIEKEKQLQLDFYTMMTDILVFRIQFFNPIAFLMLIIPTLTVLCNILKYKYILNTCTRESYQSFRKSFFFYVYRYVWLLLVLVAILMIICITYTTFDPTYALHFGSSVWKSNIIYHPVLFVLLYFVNIFLYSCAFINLALIIVRKVHSYLKAVVLSFVVYIGLELFLEVVVNALILQGIFKLNIGHLFNIMNLFMFNDTFGVFTLILFTTIIFIISCIGVYVSYKNKESFIIDCEKNC